MRMHSLSTCHYYSTGTCLLSPLLRNTRAEEVSRPARKITAMVAKTLLEGAMIGTGMLAARQNICK